MQTPATTRRHTALLDIDATEALPLAEVLALGDHEVHATYTNPDGAAADRCYLRIWGENLLAVGALEYALRDLGYRIINRI